MTPAGLLSEGWRLEGPLLLGVYLHAVLAPDPGLNVVSQDAQQLLTYW